MAAWGLPYLIWIVITSCKHYWCWQTPRPPWQLHDPLAPSCAAHSLSLGSAGQTHGAQGSLVLAFQSCAPGNRAASFIRLACLPKGPGQPRTRSDSGSIHGWELPLGCECIWEAPPPQLHDRFCTGGFRPFTAQMLHLPNLACSPPIIS